MANVIDTKKRDLFEYLNAHEFMPEALGKNGKPDKNTVPENCEAIKFYFKDSLDKKYGPILATVYQEDDKFHLHLYNSDAPWKSKEFPKFLEQLKKWAIPKKMLFSPDNSKHFHNHYTKRKYMEKQAKELSESYQAINRKTSLNDAVQTVKIIIEHSRPLAETDKRYQHISRIFIENQTGERFLINTKRPSVARVFARHIAEGNTPYDERGKHIGTLAEELKRMGGFVRATRNKQFNESAQLLVQEGLSYYQNLRETLRRMASKRGYNNYFENWTPVLVEETVEENQLNELFVKETLDPRIESVLPILSKLHKAKQEVKQVNELANWADKVINSKLEAPIIQEKIEDEKFAQTVQKIVTSPYMQDVKKWLERWKKSKNFPPLITNQEKSEVNSYLVQNALRWLNDNYQASPQEIKELAQEMVTMLKSEGEGQLSEAERSDWTWYGNMRVTSRGNPGQWVLIDKNNHQFKEGPFDSQAEALREKRKPNRFDLENTIAIQIPMDEGLSRAQKKVGQLGPTERARKISPVLGQPPKQHPFKGKLVGASESVVRKSKKK